MSEAQIVREEDKTRQYDPGYYTAAALAFPNAYLDVFPLDPATGLVREVWCLFSPIWGQHGPGALPVVTLTSTKVQAQQPYPPPPAIVPFPHPGLPAPPPGSHIHEVACKEMAPAGQTGTVTTMPLRPQPVRVGHYRLEQGQPAKRVGELIVEPSGTGDTVQHWFLCKTAHAGSNDAPYKPPTSNPSPTTYTLLGATVNNIPVKQFGDTRGFMSYAYIFAPVTFRITT